MKIKDLFSSYSKDYARYRPPYPGELFKYISDACPDHKLAWDCATGNGQAAKHLAKYFEKVIATDISEGQLAQAAPDPRIEYRLAPAHASGLETGSVSLVTVAQALHWFDVDLFSRECRRVLKPNGMLAVWSYGICYISPEIDRIVIRLHDKILATHWEPERKLVGAAHLLIPLPFASEDNPTFEMRMDMTLSDFLGYLGTWSGVKTATRATGRNPVDDLAEDFRSAWGDENSLRKVVWPLTVRLGPVRR
jgi:SAM-dependent methyltransferase